MAHDHGTFMEVIRNCIPEALKMEIVLIDSREDVEKKRTIFHCWWDYKLV